MPSLLNIQKGLSQMCSQWHSLLKFWILRVPSLPTIIATLTPGFCIFGGEMHVLPNPLELDANLGGVVHWGGGRRTLRFIVFKSDFQDSL